MRNTVKKRSRSKTITKSLALFGETKKDYRKLTVAGRMRGRTGYTHAAILLVTKDGPHQMKKTPNPPFHTTASCRVEIHLHFLIFYLVKKWRQTELMLLLDSFSHSIFYVFLFVLIALWGLKREGSQWAHLHVWTLHPVLSQVLHVKAYHGLV